MLEACVRADGSVSYEERNDDAAEFATALAFIAHRPFGVYTCVRVLPFSDDAPLPSSLEKHLVIWPYHLARISMGLQLVWKDEAKHQRFIAGLLAATTELTRRTLEQWSQMQKEKDGMLTVLWWEDGEAVRVGVHVGLLPSQVTKTINVLVHGGPRVNATCKHTKWTADRASLADFMKKCDVSIDGEKVKLDECILSEQDAASNDRCLLEGMTSNFFVVKDGCVYTAQDAVLMGSTRQLVLSACAALNIPVVLEAPRLSDAKNWQAAFITSCVRIVVPITHLLWQDQSAAMQHVTLDKEPAMQLLDRLRTAVYDRLGKWE